MKRVVDQLNNSPNTLAISYWFWMFTVHRVRHVNSKINSEGINTY